MRRFDISCKKCKINAWVSEGSARATFSAIYYCNQCNTIHNFAICKCGTKGVLMKSPEFKQTIFKERGFEWARIESGTKTITDCPSCKKKTLEWTFVGEYDA